MSHSVLYQCFGIYGYHHLRNWSTGGETFLSIVRNKKRCGFCGSWQVIQKGYRWRKLRVLPVGRKPVFAVVKMRRFFCRNCGRIRFENLVIADRKKHYTHTLENYVMELCSRMTIRDVAEHLGLNWRTVKEIDRKRLKRNLPGEKDLRELRFLGIDEVSVRRGHRYLTTVVDLETGRVVYVGEGRRVESVEPFFRRLKRIGVRLQAVAVDMWKPYARAIKRHYRRLPLVYDVFHILADYSRTLSEIRVEEAQKLEGNPTFSLIKGSRYLLLKGQEKLSEPAREKLHRLLEINRPLSIAYILKEELRLLWRLPTRHHAARFLEEWCRQALSSGVTQLARFARKLRRHAEGILNYFDFPISTAKVEGINNRIKLIKRKAYGYRDMNYFMLKIYNIHTTRYSLV
jgi:transposase